VVSRSTNKGIDAGRVGRVRGLSSTEPGEVTRAGSGLDQPSGASPEDGAHRTSASSESSL